MNTFAWVPDDDPERPWEIGIDLSVRWISAPVDRPSPVLVTNAMSSLGSPALSQFERRYARTTRRAGAGRVSSGPHTVLAYVPYAEDLEFAQRLSRGAPIVVVETVGFRVGGWAAVTAAIDLLTGEPTSPLEEFETTLIDRLKHYSSNGFGADFDRRMARASIDDAREDGDVDIDRIASALVARNVSSRAIDRLSSLFDERRDRRRGRQIGRFV